MLGAIGVAVALDCGTTDDCVLWRRGVEHAIVAVAGSTIVVLEPPVPGSGSTRNARLSGLSPDTGDRL